MDLTRKLELIDYCRSIYYMTVFKTDGNNIKVAPRTERLVSRQGLHVFEPSPGARHGARADHGGCLQGCPKKNVVMSLRNLLTCRVGVHEI